MKTTNKKHIRATSVYVLITYLDSHLLSACISLSVCIYRHGHEYKYDSHVFNGMPFAISYRPYGINETQSFHCEYYLHHLSTIATVVVVRRGWFRRYFTE